MANSWFDMLVLVGIVVVAAVGFQFALADGAPDRTVENESITVNVGGSSPVDTDAVRYNESVTIRQNGSTLVAGDDYTWNRWDGVVSWPDGTSATDGESASITYEYEEPNEQTDGLAQVLFAIRGVLPWLLVLVICVGVVTAVQESWGL